jgi:preprotein translocase subunit SecG
MENILLVLNIILAVLLVLSVLLQKSEGGALGLGASQESFVSSRAAGNFLTKATAIIATLFIINSISLTIVSRQSMPTTSVLEKVEEKQDSSEPEIPKSE